MQCLLFIAENKLRCARFPEIESIDASRSSCCMVKLRGHQKWLGVKELLWLCIRRISWAVHGILQGCVPFPVSGIVASCLLLSCIFSCLHCLVNCVVLRPACLVHVSNEAFGEFGEYEYETVNHDDEDIYEDLCAFRRIPVRKPRSQHSCLAGHGQFPALKITLERLTEWKDAFNSQIQSLLAHERLAHITLESTLLFNPLSATPECTRSRSHADFSLLHTSSNWTGDFIF